MVRPVFVYGTLKRGFGNHKKYLGECTYLGQAVTLDYFDMIDVGFPVLLPQCTETGYRVLGEVYEAGPAQLLRLDQLEANGRMYLRQPRAIQFVETDEIITADIYVGMPGIWLESQAVETKPIRRGYDTIIGYDWDYSENAWRKRGVAR